MSKIIVSHPGKQHSFKVATALKKSNRLYKYITTVYYDNNKNIYRFLDNILKNSNNKKRMHTHKCSDLDNDDIKNINEINGLITMLLIRIDKGGKISRFFMMKNQQNFSKKVAKYAIKNKVDSLIAYDTSCFKAFEYLDNKKSNIIKIMDVSSAPLSYTVDIMTRKAKQFPELSEYINSYWYMKKNNVLEERKKEILLSDYFIVASQFGKKALIESGANQDKIFVVPYGVDINKFNSIGKRYFYKEKINFLYVGGVEPRKGVFDMLEAFKTIDSERISLTIVGNMKVSEKLLEKYEGYYNYIGSYPSSEINNIYKKFDVLIQPSWHEGFSQVILEAMACEMPIICSQNTGTNDIIEEYIEGLTFKAGSIDELIEKIKYFEENSCEIVNMGKNARKKVEKYTWESYYDSINNVIKKILNNRN